MPRKNKAPYLILNGKHANIGDEYHMVYTYAPFRLITQKASTENNVIYVCYFTELRIAKHFQRMCELKQICDKQLKEIKSTYEWT